MYERYTTAAEVGENALCSTIQILHIHLKSNTKKQFECKLFSGLFSC